MPWRLAHLWSSALRRQAANARAWLVVLNFHFVCPQPEVVTCQDGWILIFSIQTLNHGVGVRIYEDYDGPSCSFPGVFFLRFFHSVPLRMRKGTSQVGLRSVSDNNCENCMPWLLFAASGIFHNAYCGDELVRCPPLHHVSHVNQHSAYWWPSCQPRTIPSLNLETSTSCRAWMSRFLCLMLCHVVALQKPRIHGFFSRKTLFQGQTQDLFRGSAQQSGT